MQIFNGCATALVTPTTTSGINVSVLHQLIDYQINNCIDAIVILGTTGEPSTLSDNEKHTLINQSSEFINKRVPLIVGSGSNNTNTAVKDSIYAQQAGADALLVVTPYYNKCNDEGLYFHYKQISDAVSIPIIIYNVPKRTGVNISSACALKLSELDNIAAIKEASGDISQIALTAMLTRNKLQLISGDDLLTLPIYSLGGSGVISVASNVAPKLVSKLIAALKLNDIESILLLNDELIKLSQLLFNDINPIPVKCAMQLLGYDVGQVRLPLTSLSADNKEKLKSYINSLDKKDLL